MDKKKILKKPKISSKNIVKLKSDDHIIPYSPTEELTDPSFMGKAITECLCNNDPEGAMEVIDIYIKTLKKVKKVKSIKRPLSKISNNFTIKNPTIKTLARIMHLSTLEDKNFNR